MTDEILKLKRQLAFWRGAAAALAIFMLLCMAHSSFAGDRLRVIDGDTIDIDGERIRILNIDTPEIHEPRCAAEMRLGQAARIRMRALLQSGTITIARGDGSRLYDRHGRTLARVFVDGRDAGEVLIAEHMARPWQGRRRSWCE